MRSSQSPQATAAFLSAINNPRKRPGHRRFMSEREPGEVLLERKRGVELVALRDAKSTEELRDLARGCRNCDLWKRGTQTVFGEGRESARVLMVGEQPGDKEDLAGRPFVGPAGALLDKALEEAGIDRNEVYVTNAVKHFKWEPRGKRRIHKKPNGLEIAACRPWLEAEIEAIHPDVIVCLGATAAQAMLGPTFRVTKQRGQFLRSSDGRTIVATVHPSSILRAPDEEQRHEEMRRFIADLEQVARWMKGKRAA